MPATPKRPKDINQLAKVLTDVSVGEAVEAPPTAKARAGRAGGLKGGKSRMASLSTEDRAKLAKKAADARWGKKTGPSRKGPASTD